MYSGNDLVDEDVDIVGGNDAPISSFPPVEIEKDAAQRNSKCSSSSSSSSESGSSSSGSCFCILFIYVVVSSSYKTNVWWFEIFVFAVQILECVSLMVNFFVHCCLSLVIKCYLSLSTIKCSAIVLHYYLAASL